MNTKAQLFGCACWYTQKQLGEFSGVSHVQIGRYESGKVKPTDKVIERLAKALEVSATELNINVKISEELIDKKYNRLKNILIEEGDKSAFCKLMDSFYLLCNNKKSIEELV